MSHSECQLLMHDDQSKPRSRISWLTIPLEHCSASPLHHVIGYRSADVPRAYWDWIRSWRSLGVIGLRISALVLVLASLYGIAESAQLVCGLSSGSSTRIGVSAFVCSVAMICWLVLSSRAKWRFFRLLQECGYEMCVECGYRLVGLPTRCRCPECGIELDKDRVRGIWGDWVSVKTSCSMSIPRDNAGQSPISGDRETGTRLILEELRPSEPAYPGKKRTRKGDAGNC